MGRGYRTSVRMVIPYKIVTDLEGRVLYDQCEKGKDQAPDWPHEGWGIVPQNGVTVVEHPVYKLEDGGELATNFKRLK